MFIVVILFYIPKILLFYVVFSFYNVTILFYIPKILLFYVVLSLLIDVNVLFIVFTVVFNPVYSLLNVEKLLCNALIFVLFVFVYVYIEFIVDYIVLMFVVCNLSSKYYELVLSPVNDLLILYIDINFLFLNILFNCVY